MTGTEVFDGIATLILFILLALARGGGSAMRAYRDAEKKAEKMPQPEEINWEQKYKTLLLDYRDQEERLKKAQRKVLEYREVVAFYRGQVSLLREGKINDR